MDAPEVRPSQELVTTTSDATREVMMAHGVTPLDDSAAAEFDEACAVFLAESDGPAEPNDEDDDVP